MAGSAAGLERSTIILAGGPGAAGGGAAGDGPRGLCTLT